MQRNEKRKRNEKLSALDKRSLEEIIESLDPEVRKKVDLLAERQSALVKELSLQERCADFVRFIGMN